jgi:xanthine dehydrogenase YagS FAD-binding subunit
MENFTLAAPQTIEAALATAQQPDTKFIAGGTDLLQLMKDFVERPKQLVDLDGLPFDRFSIGNDGARIGALVRMSDLADDPDLRRHYPLVAEALLASASPQVRNMATIGGNLLQRTRCGYFRDVGFAACNKRQPGSGCAAIQGVNRLHAILGGSDHCVATHASDLAVALTALDAAIELQGGDGMRTVPIGEFYRLPGDAPERETTMRPGEIVTAILLPPPGRAERSHYLKLRDRASFEFALVSAAVVVALEDGRIRSARVAMGGVGTRPWRLPAVEAALAGAPTSREALTAATASAAAGARPLAENGFKIPLMQRTLVRALLNATA